MKVLTDKRGTANWRELHRCRVTASDIESALAQRGTRKYANLVNRLVLDFEVPNHLHEHPDPWAEKHEQEIIAGVASYRRETGHSVLTTGLCVHDRMQWLGASPHGLIGHNGVVQIRVRRHLRTWYDKRGKIDTRTRAKLQLVMFVCDRAWVDVIDYWIGNGQVPDRLHTTRVPYDFPWLSDHVLPRLVTLWEDVAATRRQRQVV